MLPGHIQIENVKWEPEEIHARLGSPFDETFMQLDDAYSVIEFDGCKLDARIHPEPFNLPIRQESLTPP